MPEAEVIAPAAPAAPADTGGSIPAQSSEITFDQETGERVQSGAADTTGQASETDEQRNAKADAETKQRQERARTAYQKRVDELTADKHAERRAREAAEARLQRIEQEQLQNRQQPQQPAGPPDPKTFKGTYEEYVAAVAEYRTRQATAEQIRQWEQRQIEANNTARAQAAAEQIAQQFHAKHTEDAKSIPDYEAVVSNSQVPVPPHVAMELANANRPAAVIYYLAQHPDVGMQLANMAPVAVARVVSRIDAAMSSAKTTSNAPAPGKPAQGRSGGGNDDNPPEDTEAYMRWAERRKLR